MNILPIEINHEVESLLSGGGLPIDDLYKSRNLKLFGFTLDNRLAGTVGIESYDTVALLRSLAVRQNLRDAGYGQCLLGAAETWGIENGVERMYLLTTSVAKFFLKHGYQEMLRDQAPPAITKTAQFSDLCPSSAVFMCKKLIDR